MLYIEPRLLSERAFASFLKGVYALNHSCRLHDRNCLLIVGHIEAWCYSAKSPAFSASEWVHVHAHATHATKDFLQKLFPEFNLKVSSIVSKYRHLLLYCHQQLIHTLGRAELR